MRILLLSATLIFSACEGEKISTRTSQSSDGATQNKNEDVKKKTNKPATQSATKNNPNVAASAELLAEASDFIDYLGVILSVFELNGSAHGLQRLMYYDLFAKLPDPTATLAKIVTLATKIPDDHPAKAEVNELLKIAQELLFQLAINPQNNGPITNPISNLTDQLKDQFKAEDWVKIQNIINFLVSRTDLTKILGLTTAIYQKSKGSDLGTIFGSYDPFDDKCESFDKLETTRANFWQKRCERQTKKIKKHNCTEAGDDSICKSLLERSVFFKSTELSCLASEPDTREKRPTILFSCQ